MQLRRRHDQRRRRQAGGAGRAAGEFSVLAPHESLTLRASGTVRAEGLPASAACSLSRGDVPPATPLVRPGVVPATPP